MSTDKSRGREPPVIEARALRTDAVDPAFAGLEAAPEAAAPSPGGDHAPERAPAAAAASPRTGLAVAILGGAAVALLGGIALQMGNGGGGDVAALRQLADARARESAEHDLRIKVLEGRGQAAAEAQDKSIKAIAAKAQADVEAQATRLKALESAPTAPAADPLLAGKLEALEARIADVERRASAALAGLPAAAAPAAATPAPPLDLAPLSGRIEALEPRLAALEPGLAALAATGKAQAGALAAIRSGLEGLAAQAGAADTRAGMIEAKLDGAAKALADATGKIGALEGRVGPLETMLTAAKSDVRATEAKIAAVASTPNDAAVAVIAQSALQAIAGGMPVANQAAALEALGVDAARIAPLKALGDQPAAPARFKGVAALILASAAPVPEAAPGVMGWLASKASTLVQVEVVGETGGEGPAELAAKIETALGRGDIAAALAAWDKLPAPAKAATQDFAKPLQARDAATSAARSLLDEAIKGLGTRKS